MASDPSDLHGPAAHLADSGLADTGVVGSGLAGRDRWEWIQPILLAGSVILPQACSVVAEFVTPDRSASTRIMGWAAAVAFGLWAVALRSRVWRDRGDEQLRWRLIYLLGAYGLFAVMVISSPLYFFLAFLLFWHTFQLLRLKLAVPLSIGLTFEMMALQIVDNGIEDRANVIDALVTGGLTIGFSLFMATWIGGIIEQSTRRRDLIEELEATRAQLATASHETGVLAERQRLAHEIHDTLAQGFASIVMLAQALERELDQLDELGRPDGVDKSRVDKSPVGRSRVDKSPVGDPDFDRAPARRHVLAIERTARDNLAEARNLVEGAHPAALDTDSLPDAVRRLADRLGADLDVDARADIIGEPRPLSSAVEVALLRAAQEALTNVRKHAAPTSVRLTLRYDDDGGTLLEVTDDGAGFDVHDAATDMTGFGLRGMRSRLERVGGAVDVRSHIGGGTRVTVRLP